MNRVWLALCLGVVVLGQRQGPDADDLGGGGRPGGPGAGGGGGGGGGGRPGGMPDYMAIMQGMMEELEHELEYKKMEMMHHAQMCMKRDIPAAIAHHMNMMDMNIMLLQQNSNTPAPFCGASIPLVPCHSPMDLGAMMTADYDDDLENNEPRMSAHVVCIKRAMLNDQHHLLQPRNLHWVEGVEIEMDADDMHWLKIPAVAEACVAFMIMTPANVAAGNPMFDTSVTAVNSLNSKLQTKYDMLKQWEDRNLQANGCRMHALFEQITEDGKTDAMRAREMMMNDDNDDHDIDGEMDMEQKMMEMMMQGMEQPSAWDAATGMLYHYKFGAYRRAQRGIAHSMFGEWVDHMPSIVERTAMQAHRATNCEQGENPVSPNIEGSTDMRRSKLGSSISALMMPMDGGESMLNADSRATIAEMSCRLWAVTSTRIIQSPCLARPMDMANFARIQMTSAIVDLLDGAVDMIQAVGTDKKPTKVTTQQEGGDNNGQQGPYRGKRGGGPGMPDMGWDDYYEYEAMYADCPFLSFPEDWEEEIGAKIYAIKQKKMMKIKKRIMEMMMRRTDGDDQDDTPSKSDCLDGPITDAINMFSPEAHELLMGLDAAKIHAALRGLLQPAGPTPCNCPCDNFHGKSFQCKKQQDNSGLSICAFEDGFCVPAL